MIMMGIMMSTHPFPPAGTLVLSLAQSIASWLIAFTQKQEKCTITVQNGLIILLDLLERNYSAITE